MFRILLIAPVGKPRWLRASFAHRSPAVKFAQDLILNGTVKAAVVYRGEKPTQLLVHRPQTYVHLERI